MSFKLNAKKSPKYLARRLLQFLHFSKIFIKKPLKFDDVKKSKLKNITILAAGRDLDMLKISLKYLSAFIDYKNILLITPSRDKVIENLPVTIVEDKEILNDEEINFFKNPALISCERFFLPNWYMQQYIKLVHVKRLSLENSFIIDCDTIPLKPPKIFHNSKLVVPYTHEYRPQYHDYIQEHVLKEKVNRKNIHIPHFCFFEQRVLELINNKLGDLGSSMFEVVKHACKHEHFFSEYELYNQFLLSSFPDEVIEIYYNGINLPREIKYVDNIDIAGLFDYASFHYWKRAKFLPFY